MPQLASNAEVVHARHFELLGLAEDVNDHSIVKHKLVRAEQHTENAVAARDAAQADTARLRGEKNAVEKQLATERSKLHRLAKAAKDGNKLLAAQCASKAKATKRAYEKEEERLRAEIRHEKEQEERRLSNKANPPTPTLSRRPRPTLKLSKLLALTLALTLILLSKRQAKQLGHSPSLSSAGSFIAWQAPHCHPSSRTGRW